jgi:hypothetical protein
MSTTLTKSECIDLIGKLRERYTTPHLEPSIHDRIKRIATYLSESVRLDAPHTQFDYELAMRAQELALIADELRAALSTAPQAREWRGLDAIPTNWELSWGAEDEESPGNWCVHLRGGSRNDREWTLIGQGSTPSKAISAALKSNNHGGGV